MNINFVDLKAQYKSIKYEIDTAIQTVIDSTAFAGGPFVKSFEQSFAEAQGAKYCAAVNSGTAALHITLMALNIGYGDEVIVPANTFFATPEAVSLAGAIPVFADCEEDYYNLSPNGIEDKITNKTKAIIAVNLYGQPAQLDEIKAIAEKRGLHLIEDCAQSHLAVYKDIPTGNYGIAGCFSFYPGKNLGAFGEGGAALTNSKEIYDKIQALKDHGSPRKYYHEYIGHNYRMEGLQGAVLGVKLKHLADWTAKRRANAKLYNELLSDVKEVVTPKEMPTAKHVYHLYVIRAKKRDELMKYLSANGIGSGIHYPVPCHLQKAYSFLKYSEGSFPNAERFASDIISLPMYAELSHESIEYVCNAIKKFYEL